jgi:hypothetical protein
MGRAVDEVREAIGVRVSRLLPVCGRVTGRAVDEVREAIGVRVSRLLPVCGG